MSNVKMVRGDDVKYVHPSRVDECQAVGFKLEVKGQKPKEAIEQKGNESAAQEDFNRIEAMDYLKSKGVTWKGNISNDKLKELLAEHAEPKQEASE